MPDENNMPTETEIEKHRIREAERQAEHDASCEAWEDEDDLTPFDKDGKFRAWLDVLDEEVIQGEYGYEPGEFTVYSSHWHPTYLEGLTPAEAFKRALDAFAEERREIERQRKERRAQIEAADAALLRR